MGTNGPHSSKYTPGSFGLASGNVNDWQKKIFFLIWKQYGNSSSEMHWGMLGIRK